MEKTEFSTPIVICDAGPLIHLDEIGCLDLLSDFARVIIPDAVWEEVEHHRPTVFSFSQINFTRQKATQRASPQLSAIAQIYTLHAGEWEALRLAQDFPDSILLTDDAAARMAASNLGLKIHGTFGVLLRAIRRKQRTKSEVLKTLKLLPEMSTLHLKPSLFESVVKQVEMLKI